ncbi:hypothetical protein SAMN05216420_102127 [Nitrosospira sp. Nl5]|nr:hypothetical protein SAMN05216420_102127 [Nitrosospira sp. Nl5]
MFFAHPHEKICVETIKTHRVMGGLGFEVSISHSIEYFYQRFPRNAKYIAWAQNREQSGLSLRTLQDREKYWKKLGPVFSEASIDQLRPG